MHNPAGDVDIVQGVDIQVAPGEVLGIVGESGSGKSMTVAAAMRLLPEPPAEVTASRLMVGGANMLTATKREIREFRGGRAGMIFQDPLTSLNPVLSIGFQIDETLRYHSSLTRAQRHDRVIELLDRVKIDAPPVRYAQFPHQFSGGMQQRVGIAMAIANNPSVLVADEPTTALDVSVQRDILNLIRSLIAERNMAAIFITHDLGVVSEIADEVAVMYAGQIVERGRVEEIFKRPQHPYTIGLLRSRPTGAMKGKRLASIPGQPPEPASRPYGCPFEPRCPIGQGREICRTRRPALIDERGHAVACHFTTEAVKLSSSDNGYTRTSDDG